MTKKKHKKRRASKTIHAPLTLKVFWIPARRAAKLRARRIGEGLSRLAAARRGAELRNYRHPQSSRRAARHSIVAHAFVRLMPLLALTLVTEHVALNLLFQDLVAQAIPTFATSDSATASARANEEEDVQEEDGSAMLVSDTEGEDEQLASIGTQSSSDYSDTDVCIDDDLQSLTSVSDSGAVPMLVSDTESEGEELASISTLSSSDDSDSVILIDGDDLQSLDYSSDGEAEQLTSIFTQGSSDNSSTLVARTPIHKLFEIPVFALGFRVSCDCELPSPLALTLAYGAAFACHRFRGGEHLPHCRGWTMLTVLGITWLLGGSISALLLGFAGLATCPHWCLWWPGGEVESKVRELAKDIERWQKKSKTDRAPSRAGKAKAEEQRLAVALSKIIASVRKQEISEEGIARLRAIPGVAEQLPGAAMPLSKAQKLVRETIAWQQQTGLQRLPSQASTASKEEDGLA